MNHRRRLLISLGVAAGMPQAVFAQAKRAPVVIGWLHPGSRKADGHFVGTFKEGMTALGWKDGVTFVVEERWLDSRVERTQPVVEELVAKKPAVVVAFGSAPSLAVTKTSPATPIVQIAGYPVEFGLAKSLARPGGMVTGLMNIAFELAEKRLELLLDAAPGLKRIGFLIDTSSSFVQERALSAARHSIARYPVEARFAEAARPEDIEPALSRLAKDGIQALIVMPGLFVPSERNRVMPVALTQRWLVVTGHPEWTEAGALLDYGADLGALYRRAAYFVDRILKGTKPGDLPIEQPTTFELIVNARTARALGLALPRELLVRADRIIK